MFTHSNPKLVAGFRKLSLIGSSACVLVAVLALVGWLNKIDALRCPIPGQLPMAPLPSVFITLTALSSLLLSLRVDDKRAHWVAKLSGVLVCVSSLLALLKFACHFRFDLESWLFGRWIPEASTSYLARIAPTEATSCFLAAAALLVLGRRKKVSWLGSQLIAAFMSLIPFFALVGYWYGVPFFYGLAAYTQMSLETAFVLLILGLSIFFMKPNAGLAGLITSDDAGGVMIRRMLPATILIPLVYGWLKILGQRLGLFERDFGTTLLILLMIVSTTIVVVLNARHLNNIDAERERLLEQRDNVMAVLTHDLKNPLIGADRVLELFVTGAIGPVSAEQNELLSKLKHSNEDLLNSIQNLLELYRYDRGTATLRFVEVDLLPIINKCIEDLRPQLESHRLNLRTLFPERLSMVQADATAIKHVLTNLIHNALKFTPDGGEIEVSAQEQTGVVIVKVKDTGKGIPKEEQETLFQPFSRGALGKKYKTGAGLGLYLCYQIVKAHHGVLTCISEVGAGTTFIVSLPTKQQGIELLPTQTGKTEIV